MNKEFEKEALRLADALDSVINNYLLFGGDKDALADAAAELRRLHALNAVGYTHAAVAQAHADGYKLGMSQVSHAGAQAVPSEAEIIALLGDPTFSSIGAVREALRRWGAAPAAVSAPSVPTLTQAAHDVLAERQRQISVEGWTPEHDDEHDFGHLARAGAAYAAQSLCAEDAEPECGPPGWWPWERTWWKPNSRRGMLVKAGALILAEMERLDRAAGKGAAPTTPITGAEMPTHEQICDLLKIGNPSKEECRLIRLGYAAALRAAAPATLAELTDAQIAATAGRLGGMSESLPLGQQWDLVKFKETALAGWEARGQKGVTQIEPSEHEFLINASRRGVTLVEKGRLKDGSHGCHWPECPHGNECVHAKEAGDK